MTDSVRLCGIIVVVLVLAKVFAKNFLSPELAGFLDVALACFTVLLIAVAFLRLRGRL